MNTKATDFRIKLEDIAFWTSMVSVITMSVFYITEAGRVILELSFLTITTSGLFGLFAAFCFGLQASLKGRPDHGAAKHISFSLFMAVFCLALYVAGHTAFEFITSSLS
ncbi:hypothetical protein [Rhodohalobacter sp.]|uniref:hypothetical protein n=1 Tax=Rhodohalobacter sp. TaxID=1974210 RepID=UPI002ACD8165|nr:hypothetical protein [Rhodohalobacter sp.]MDZ7756656.1 hypothetical protein [Rhodohalobacter sp.]